MGDVQGVERQLSMARLLILGATGNLGSVLTRAAVDAGHAVMVLVRDPARLHTGLSGRITVSQGDLSAMDLADLSSLMAEQDAVINTAGYLADGVAFTRIVDRVASAAEALDSPPVAWFLAGGALLELDDKGRTGMDLPLVGPRCQPHADNLARLAKGKLDWRLLCPGPMVDEPGVGLERLRVSIDHFAAPLPAATSMLPSAALLPFFAARLGQITIPYADAAAVILGNLSPGGPLSRHRVGIALPAGMTKRKKG